MRDRLVPALAAEKSKFIDRVRRFDLTVMVAGLGLGLWWYLQLGVAPGQGRMAEVIANPVPYISVALLVLVLLAALRWVWVRWSADRTLANCEQEELSAKENRMLKRAAQRQPRVLRLTVRSQAEQLGPLPAAPAGQAAGAHRRGAAAPERSLCEGRRERRQRVAAISRRRVRR